MKRLSLVSLLAVSMFAFAGCESAPWMNKSDKSAPGNAAGSAAATAPVAGEYLADGDTYFQQGNYDMAIVSYSMALDEQPDLSAAHRGLEKTYMQLGLDELAQRNHDHAVELEQISRQQAIQAAVQTTEIEVLPASGDASQADAAVMTETTEVTEISQMQPAAKPAPAPKAAAPAPKAEAARPVAVSAGGPDSALLTQAQAQLDAGQTEAAMRTYLSVLSKDHNNATANRQMAKILLGRGGGSEALPFARAALAANDHDAQAWELLGLAQYRSDLYPEAVSSFENAERLGKLSDDAQMAMAKSLLRVGRNDAAVIRLEQLDKQNPTSETAGLLGSILLRDHQLDRAEALLKRAVQTDPHNTTYLNKLGACYFAQFRKNSNPSLRAAAMDAWSRSLEINPNQKQIKTLMQTLGGN